LPGKEKELGTRADCGDADQAVPADHRQVVAFCHHRFRGRPAGGDGLDLPVRVAGEGLRVLLVFLCMVFLMTRSARPVISTVSRTTTSHDVVDLLRDATDDLSVGVCVSYRKHAKADPGMTYSCPALLLRHRQGHLPQRVAWMCFATALAMLGFGIASSA